MASLEIQAPNSATATATTVVDREKYAIDGEEADDVSPIEQVRLTVTHTDDPTLPVWTFRMWSLGLISCALLSFLNQFFGYRTEPLVITQISVQVASLPVGQFMAAVLPKKQFQLPGLGSRKFSLNPGPFNMKEHVLITIFANAGSAFGSGTAYAVGIVTIVKAFYGRSISFLAGWLLIITTQLYSFIFLNYTTHFFTVSSMEIQASNPSTKPSDPEKRVANGENYNDDDDEEISPIEEVRLTVTNTDDPSLPVWTFRMWILGLFSCALLSFLNQFFSYRTEPLIITQITVQVATLPIGHFLASVLPKTQFKIPGFGSRSFSLNPGAFNMKEHVLICIFANAGSAFGNGSAYAVSIVNIIKAFYGRKISFLASWFLIITTQVLGYGWAGLLRKYVVEPAHMWWPSTLVQVSLFRALHEKDDRRMTRAKFFLIALICSFSWYLFPGYLFSTLTSISWVCWIFSKSVTAQQLGSGMRGLGLGAFTLDWSAVASFLFSPLISPFFAIVNVFVGYVLIIYIAIPVAYWGLDLYNASRFPIFSSHLFTARGQKYNITAIVNDKFEIDLVKYEEQGRINLSMFFALTYGFGFATIASTLTHVALFYGREIYDRYRASYTGKEDIHTRLMKKYKDIPSWWFYILLAATLVVSLALCIFLNDQVQMPWWGLIFASAMAFIFTLPISIITATTNQTPGLNIITEYVMGIIYPGRPIANVCFKTYGYMSMAQAVSFLNDFKLGHYMKIPPRSMFLVQFIGTILAGTINIAVAWWLLDSIENICQDDLLPADSPWTCPGDRVFFDASVIWGLVGPRRIFGSLGNYRAMNWFFLGGALGPVIVWLLHKTFPKQSWIPLINLPVLLGATGMMPPATAVNYNSWILVGTIFNFFVFRYRKQWWQRYNYILSAALDAGVAFMAILLYFSVGMENRSLTWWGTDGEHCDLATCPTAKGIVVEGCPLY